MPFIFLIIIPLVAAAFAFALPNRVKFIQQIALVGSTLFFIASVAHALYVYALPDHQLAISPWFLFDAIGAYMTVIVGFVFLSAMYVSHKYMLDEQAAGNVEKKHVTMYYGYTFLFVVAMTLTLAANNMILMWVALEFSTLATTLLVAFSRKKRSLEAAWKYIVLCSTGLLVSLFGVLMFHVALSGNTDAVILEFSYYSALTALPIFDPLFLKIAFVFLIVGLGTKVGLVPMHNWLPDAHGETPAPISAMLSGVLLSVALVVLVRFKGLVDGLLGDVSWTGHFFIFFGVLSVAYAGIMMLKQDNYKRLLAYSSIEHMGLATFGFALGPIGMVASLIHIAGHALLKPILFFASGEIYHRYHTTNISDVHGLSKNMPKTGNFFFFALLGLLAMPPSALFLSELIMITEGVRTTLFATIVVALSIVAASYGLLKGFFLMSKEHESDMGHVPVREGWTTTHSVLAVQMILLLCLSLFALSRVGQDVLLAVINSVTLGKI